ncbi:MAG: hypothetical protein KJ057_07460 [Phycisphaerae bacterium]|nr:MAG: hypothetical protein F9K17_12190 [Phycisphaerae bacterium]MBE7457016.1 hypothetical protein [Planctomycetia bacterium]MCK6463625.1 M12 family metallo-peptidase [Phycisphaerae bacterium]MCL4718294.1 hypothetical protein [Phycisphaerae bacterium]NUQ10577.1 hypothetical protein [Phycisphaerae bacterium]
MTRQMHAFRFLIVLVGASGGFASLALARVEAADPAAVRAVPSAADRVVAEPSAHGASTAAGGSEVEEAPAASSGVAGAGREELARRAAGLPAVLASPLTVNTHAVAEMGVRLDVAPTTYEVLHCESTVVLTGFPISATDRVDLELEQFHVTMPDTQFVIGTDLGDIAVEHPRVALLRGRVAGFDDSWVFLGVTPDFINGVIHLSPDEEYILSPVSLKEIVPGDSNHGMYNRFAPEAQFAPFEFACDPEILPGTEPFLDGSGGGDEPISGFSWRVARVATDADFEFRNRFSTAAQAMEYCVVLLASISTIYERDMNLKLAAVFVRVWDTSNDPFTANNTADALTEMRNFWNNNMGSVSRSIAHLLSAKDLGGGRASLSQICTSSAYGVNGNMSGSFPRPLRDRDNGNWDVVVFAHEMGHNFGTHHTHCFNPPLDQCYNEEDGCWGGARVCGVGTIMSYCHTCNGGLANINLVFHPSCSVAIRNHVDGRGSCAPPARDPCFVDRSNGGAEDGTSGRPYNSILEGMWFVIPGGAVRIQAGTYNETFPSTGPLNRPMTLSTTTGTVRIGG